ncbi:tetratricopeptide repeat protein [Streptomyces sp. NPDC013433]|uniref:tetratricopeptide repeat protein n=1 Tax=Streptomyces sp. NPDC013433 TaxID=3155604 RepID=UPI003452CB78
MIGQSIAVSASADGVAAGRDIKGSALGDNSRVTYIDKQFVTAEYASVQWPVVVGRVPVLASAFQPRDGLRHAIDAARGRSQSIVLASDHTESVETARLTAGIRTSVQVMSGGGGVGKSQLAAVYAREAIQTGTDLLLWAPASDLQQLLTVYAQAALLVQAPGCTGRDLEADARAFVDWLAATDRRWLVVLDDITAPDAIEPWWPDSPRGTGWALATTRLKDPRLTGGGRTRIDVDVYTAEEAIAYLTTRLTEEGRSHLVDDKAIVLAQALGYLPLALGHAAAYMIREGASCRTYLQQFTDRSARLDDLFPHWADTERYGRQITTTLLLALDATDQSPLGSLARAALHLTAVLDPEGHPAAMWDTSVLASYLTGRRLTYPPRRGVTWRWRRTGLQPVTGEEARAALRLLDRYGLIAYDGSVDGLRAVRIHALTARAVRETATVDQRRLIAIAAAEALVDVWSDPDRTHHELAGVLRANTDVLSAHARNTLWTSGCHTVLFYAGRSLLKARLGSAALAYWENMVIDSERILGNGHPDTLTSRNNFAAAYQQAGQTSEAIKLLKQLVADREEISGDDHPKTLLSRANLAACYQQAGRVSEAIELLEQVVSNNASVLGNDHPDTLTFRINLAASYQETGRTSEAIELLERVVSGSEYILGANHPRTLIACAKLANSYHHAGQIREAIELSERVVAEYGRVLGNNHPDTLAACTDLASYYQHAGRTSEAIELLEQSVALHEHLQSEDRPDTLNARLVLAISYRHGGQANSSIELLEKVVADSQRVLGKYHPETLNARANLAISYRSDGRISKATTLLERVVADSKRVFDSDHPQILSYQGSLATSYWQAGRISEAIVIEEKVASDCERVLGNDHIQTVTARNNLAMSYHQAGRLSQAVDLLKKVVADRERVLGRNHPDTLDARDGLAHLLGEG